jgi:hypothetical protein
MGPRMWPRPDAGMRKGRGMGRLLLMACLGGHVHASVFSLTCGRTVCRGPWLRLCRDSARCAAKYGEDWKEYTRQVPYVFIPGVY